MARYKTPKTDKFDITEWQKSVKESINENSSDREWEVYVADDPYGKNEKVVKSGASKRSAVILYNKLVKSDKHFAVGMRVVNESVNEADITVGGKEYKLIKKGSKITLINTKLSADKYIFGNDKQFKAWADDQVEPIGGTQSSHFGINEAKPDLVSMMRMAVTATKKSKQSSSTIKTYLKSLAKDLAKNAKDYVDYDQDDWVEDLENWIADRG